MKLKLSAWWVPALLILGCSSSKSPAPVVPVVGPSQPSEAKPIPETDPTLGAAWFVGPNKKVKVCLESGADFPVAPPKLRELVTKAFQTWHDYLGAKKVAEELGVPNLPAFTPQLLDKCEGADLQLRFGTSDVQAEGRFAVSHRSAYDQKSGWGAGWIWFAPRLPSATWNEKTLLPALLHALGEIAGNDPVPGTIMDERLGELLEKHGDDTIAKIDLSRELYVCASCPAQYEAKLKVEKNNQPFLEALLAEKPHDGEVTVTLERDFYQGWKNLEVKYEGGELKIPAAQTSVSSLRLVTPSAASRVFRSYLNGTPKFAASLLSISDVIAQRSRYDGKVLVTVSDNASDDFFRTQSTEVGLTVIGENGEPVWLLLTRKP